jgi:putative ATPase
LKFDEKAKNILINYANGDARKILNTLEIFVNSNRTKIDSKDLLNFLKNESSINYDKSGEFHYDLISAFHKSLRGSDVDASLYWMFKMLESGEDPLYILRRMVRFASEDVGLADPYALTLAVSVLNTVKFLGMPEADNALVELVIYLALCPKSNSCYKAAKKAKEYVKRYPNLEVPLHLRNAPTKLMKELGYSKGYKYPHNYENSFVIQQYMPDKLKNVSFYEPGENGTEKKMKTKYEFIKKSFKKEFS